MSNIKTLVDFEKLFEDAKNRTGLRKIADLPKPCNHPEHYPPAHICLKPGIYEYTCPGCGHIQRFTVPFITL